MMTPEMSEMDTLPDSIKEDLCRELLEEFGAKNIKSSGDGELIHSCCLPFGLHANGDKNPSASLNYKKLAYNCYGCGGGSLLWFIGVCRGTGSSAARHWIGQQVGGGPDEQSLSSLLEFFDSIYSASNERVAQIPFMDQRVLDPYKILHPYMTEIRGCDPEWLMAHSVGYGQFRVPARKGGDVNYVDSPRIVIPHFWNGQLVGWQSRRLISDGTPKYLNTPDFPKDQTLYNFSQSRDEVIVVESALSVLRHGAKQQMTATFGAGVTKRQIKLLSRKKSVILWFDNDSAGWRATSEVGDALEPYMEVRVVDSPWSADAGDLPDSEFARLVGSAVPYALWSPPKDLSMWVDVQPTSTTESTAS